MSDEIIIVQLEKSNRTVVDNQMDFKFFNLAANEIIDMRNTSNFSIRNFYNITKETRNIYLAHI
ncbi:hypothetical protein Glove_83g20 [Diversispora epigaea]|uniref:Uncharacterized protein n=1 Tax=Diversispora epigaea TaxID=1348612 RepID=A0A397JGM9_9GLOM|nr:hypothetical protein Glove_83g20 [Diversispora epigaea]